MWLERETSNRLSPEDLDVSGSVEKGTNNARRRDYIHTQGRAARRHCQDFRSIPPLSCTFIEFHVPTVGELFSMWLSLWTWIYWRGSQLSPHEAFRRHAVTIQSEFKVFFVKIKGKQSGNGYYLILQECHLLESGQAGLLQLGLWSRICM